MLMINNSLYLNRLATPIVTGNAVIPQSSIESVPQKSSDSQSFRDILQQQINDVSKINFSKHAVNRVMERNIDISDNQLERLNEGVKIAEQKGLNDTLILVDSAAYIVNIRNNTVVTTVSNDDLKGNVFTNIDGTVII